MTIPLLTIVTDILDLAHSVVYVVGVIAFVVGLEFINGMRKHVVALTAGAEDIKYALFCLVVAGLFFIGGDLIWALSNFLK